MRLMKSPVISVFAETASSVFPEGADCAASETTASTVTESDAAPTARVMEISDGVVLAMIPDAVAVEKPVADACTEYVPAGGPVTVKRPSLSVAAPFEIGAVSLFTTTTAFGIALPA